MRRGRQALVTTLGLVAVKDGNGRGHERDVAHCKDDRKSDILIGITLLMTQRIPADEAIAEPFGLDDESVGVIAVEVAVEVRQSFDVKVNIFIG